MLIGRLRRRRNSGRRPSGSPVSSSRTSASASDVGSRVARPGRRSDRGRRAGRRVSRLAPNPLCCDCCPTVRWTPASVSSGSVRLSSGKEPDSRAMSPPSSFCLDGRIAVAGSYQITDSDRKDDPLYRVPQPFVAVVAGRRHTRPGIPSRARRRLPRAPASATSPTDLVVTGDKLLVAAHQSPRPAEHVNRRSERTTIEHRRRRQPGRSRAAALLRHRPQRRRVRRQWSVADAVVASR